MHTCIPNRQYASAGMQARQGQGGQATQILRDLPCCHILPWIACCPSVKALTKNLKNCTNVPVPCAQVDWLDSTEVQSALEGQSPITFTGLGRGVGLWLA